MRRALAPRSGSLTHRHVTATPAHPDHADATELRRFLRTATFLLAPTYSTDYLLFPMASRGFRSCSGC
jgi:hypothetical protein